MRKIRSTRMEGRFYRPGARCYPWLPMTYHADRAFKLYFVRHGITEPNFRGVRCGGDLDVPMMDIGCDQAYLLAKQILRMDLGIRVIIAGSLLRTRQTAHIISG